MAIEDFLANQVYILIHALFYPFQVILSVFINAVNLVVSAFSGLVSSLYNIVVLLNSFLVACFSILLPSVLAQLIVLFMYTLVFLRVYFIIRGSD